MTPIIPNLSSGLSKLFAHTILFLTLSFISMTIKTARSIPIDNGIGAQPEILCLQDSMLADVSRILECADSDKHLEAVQRSYVRQRDVPFQSVLSFGPHKLRPAGLSYSTVVIVQFHHLFITKVDRAYRLTCFYMEVDKVVTQGIHVSMIPTTQVSDTRPMPTCKYEVLAGALNGPPVRFAKVGDKVFHKWTCESGVHGMLVHSCIARDGAGSVYELIDKKGCAVDPIALGDLTYSGDLIMAHAQVHVFKFADQMVVNFQCQISLCVKTDGGCNELTPPPCTQGPPAGSTYPLAPLQPISPDLDESYPANPPPADNFGIPAPAQIPQQTFDNAAGSGSYPNPFPPPVASPKESLSLGGDGRGGPIRIFPPNSIPSSTFLDPSFPLSNPSQTNPDPVSFDPSATNNQQTARSEPLLRLGPSNPINSNVGPPLAGGELPRTNPGEIRGEVGVDGPGFDAAGAGERGPSFKGNLQQQPSSNGNQGFTSQNQQLPPPPPGLPEEPPLIAENGVQERFGEVGDIPLANDRGQLLGNAQSRSRLPTRQFRDRQGPPTPVLNPRQEKQRRFQQASDRQQQQLTAPELRGRRDFPQPVPPEQFAFDAANFSSSQLLNSGGSERNMAVGTSGALWSTNRRRRQRTRNQKGDYQALPSGVGLAPASRPNGPILPVSRTHRRQPTHSNQRSTNPISHEDENGAAFDPSLFGAVPVHQTFRPPVAKIKKREIPSSGSDWRVVEGTLDVTSEDMIVFNLDDSFPASC